MIWYLNLRLKKQEIIYHLKLEEVLGKGSDAVVTFDVIITDIIVDGDDRYDKWEEGEFEKDNDGRKYHKQGRLVETINNYLRFRN